MTTQRDGELIPEWTLGDRLRKARTLTGLSVREFADRIGVSHGTVTSAELDKREVRRITLNAWAMATGVPIEWLERGIGTSQAPRPPDSTDGGTGSQDALAALTRKKRSRNGTTSPGVSTAQYPTAA